MRKPNVQGERGVGRYDPIWTGEVLSAPFLPPHLHHTFFLITLQQIAAELWKFHDFSQNCPGGGNFRHKLYGDVPSFKAWFFDRPVISRVSNSNISKILYKQVLKITHFDENVRGI